MYQSLQGGRAFAAAIVVLFHLGGTFAQDKYFGVRQFDDLFAWGDSGVDFFFVLSGFLITKVHRRDFGHPRALGAYVAKRTLRIYPTYWLICVAVLLSALAVPSLRQALPRDLQTTLVALTLVPMDPAVVGGTGSPILFVAWSLQYEMTFYAIVAVAIVNRLLGGLLAIGVLAVVASCHLGGHCGFPLSFLASDMVLLFGLGVATAYVAESDLPLPFSRTVAVLASFAFVAFGAFELIHGRDSLAIDRRLIYGCISCIAILGFVRAEDERRLVLRHRALQVMGDSSYALYLVHIPIISVLVKLAAHRGLTGGYALTALFVMIFAACVAVSVLFHLIVEKPLLRWLRSLLHVRKRAAVRQTAMGSALLRGSGEVLR